MRVFLLHGMARTPVAMWWLGRRLKAAGHEPSYFGYLVTFHSLEEIAARFAQRVRRVLEEDGAEGASYAVVGHSLGCVITRLAVPELPPGFARFVMLAPPNRPPVLARVLKDNPVFRALSGDAGRKLSDAAFYDALPRPPVPSLIIAGTRGFTSPRLPFAGERNDTIVKVEETRLEGVPALEVEGAHSFLMNRRDVFEVVERFLDAAAPQLPRGSGSASMASP